MNYYDEISKEKLEKTAVDEVVEAGYGSTVPGNIQTGVIPPVPEQHIHIPGSESKFNPGGTDRIIPAKPETPIYEECIFLHHFGNIERVQWLKAQLTATDYAIIKISEGSAEREEYADLIEQRRAWRREINSLENDMRGDVDE